MTGDEGEQAPRRRNNGSDGEYRVMAGPVHFEVYTRKTVQSPWALLQATEVRAQAFEVAEEMLADKRAVAVRVTKETLDTETMEFQSITVLQRGAPEPPKPRSVRNEGHQSNCNAPADLYTPHARELIARILEDWLGRHGVTAFELMHRPDLVEKLEASGVEYQHAIQKIAVPEAQDTGQPVHELVRHYQRLGDGAMERVIRTGKKGRFADLAAEPLVKLATRLSDDPDRAFLMGGAVARHLAPARNWRDRLTRLVDLADAAPKDGQPRALCLVAIEQVLIEMVGSGAAMAEIIGPSLDLGETLAVMARMAAPREVEALIAGDARLSELIPPIEGPTARLAEQLSSGFYPLLSNAMARRVLRELMSPRRLRRRDAVGEIEILRALAMALTASAGRLLSLDDVQNAFVERSKALVTADFVAAYIGQGLSAPEEAEALLKLCENVTGLANKRAAGRWLSATVCSLRLEKAVREWNRPAGARLHWLASMQRGVRLAGLPEKENDEITEALGRLGCLVEADARLIGGLARTGAPVLQKITALLRMATGESAPVGPASERARAEALKLLRQPGTRAALAETPDALAPIRSLMASAGLGSGMAA